MASKVRTMPILIFRKVATLKLSTNEARMLAFQMMLRMSKFAFVYD
ncbi:hypothetical protein T11_6260 [Trichinella zimbabwensis]|uniref:Uncharacterized protein n=1 Tax=Trichinella zimbabwensis TaxID=268475 RepID=A0A0V1GKI4_9BILA|nr:hypothetical protein T11_6260 [Trichinella zimbabwensis]